MISENFFNQIQQQLNNKLPFVVYRKPNDTLVKVLLQNTDEVHIVKDYSEKGFVFAPFDTNKEVVLIPLNISSLLQEDFVMSSVVETSYLESDDKIKNKEKHIELVQKGIDGIKEKQFQKVVLSRCEKIKLTEIDCINVFKKLLQKYPTAFVYCWYHPKIGLWLGATPETLIKIEGSRFKTMALAGTQKFEGTLDVNWQDKEKEEQQFVTDFIVDSLKTSVKNLTISNIETIKAGNVLHLKTTIKGILDLNLLNLKQVIKVLHPTPAVCGLPKESTKQFIINNENYNREYYTGFLGELNFQEKTTRNTNRRNVENNAYASVKHISNLFVNLRCMQIIEKKALIYVGGGITKDSIPEAEWQETVVKAEVMKKVLQ
ncbi:chorismate-binding protein [Formosa maritima]|uniref:Isochorismate synthase n=1 Tax=Formosa maritima TaxID=2592046 RepID=A0A5D0GK29_9FLAO|nr:chorismate-binding protein [Formosa maritima]TYA59140.1 isochorismate synthase [Formosa maritima]